MTPTMAVQIERSIDSITYVTENSHMQTRKKERWETDYILSKLDQLSQLQ